MISFIIPVYNTGNKLNKCLRSLERQTYKDWECFLVNDCSTDKSTIKILNETTHKDQRFVLINNTKNLGIEKNRFVAVDRIIAEGKSQYIMFMDHDDWLYSNDALSYLYENAVSSGADVTIGRNKEAYGPFLKDGYYYPESSGLISQPILKEKYYISYFGVNLIPVYIWARLYKLDLVKKANMRAHGLTSADDVAWNLFIMPFANSVMLLNRVVYVHRWGGLSTKISNKGLEEYKKFYKLRRKAIIDFDYSKARFWLDCELKNVLAANIYNLILYLKQDKEEIISYLRKELEDDIWTEVDESIINSKNEFSQALLSRDFEKMYEIQYRQAYTIKNRFYYFVKQLLRPFI